MMDLFVWHGKAGATICIKYFSLYLRWEAVFLSNCSQEIYLTVLEKTPRLLQIARKALHQRSARIFQVMSIKIKIICMLRHVICIIYNVYFKF